MIKNIFFYLTAFITLCYDVWHLLSIIFDTIEKKIPDVIDNGYSIYNSYSDDSFRFSIASLVVMFPIYVGVSWYINREIENGKMDTESKIRHVMIWSTLLMSISSIAGSLITAVYSYLGGELSARLGYKCLAVAIVAIAIGAYHYYLLNKSYINNPNAKRNSLIIATASIVIIFAISTYCIYVVGSPAVARARKLDEKSISNLTRIEYSLSNKFETNGNLPDTLDNSFKINNLDPNTNLPYPYKVISQDAKLATFELCPVFATVYEDKNYYVNLSQEFFQVFKNYSHDPRMSHDIGKTCYQVTLTKNSNKINGNI